MKDGKLRLGVFFCWVGSGTSSYAETNLPRPEDFAKALYTLDIGQNDLHFGLKSMTEEQLKALFPNITGMLAQTVKVTES